MRFVERSIPFMPSLGSPQSINVIQSCCEINIFNWRLHLNMARMQVRKVTHPWLCTFWDISDLDRLDVWKLVQRLVAEGQGGGAGKGYTDICHTRPSHFYWQEFREYHFPDHQRQFTATWLDDAVGRRENMAAGYFWTHYDYIGYFGTGTVRKIQNHSKGKKLRKLKSILETSWNVIWRGMYKNWKSVSNVSWGGWLASTAWKLVWAAPIFSILVRFIRQQAHDVGSKGDNGGTSVWKCSWWDVQQFNPLAYLFREALVALYLIEFNVYMVEFEYVLPWEVEG